MLIHTSCRALAEDNKVVLATSENIPYIGEDLPSKGYVSELVETVFRRAGYQVEIQFFPAARARNLALSGVVADGLVPVYGDSAEDSGFMISDAFPGGNIGLLKNVSDPIVLTLQNNLKDTIDSLSAYKLGLVRGHNYHPLIDSADNLRKEWVNRDIQNIDKLVFKRIQFALFDKYTAADLIVNLRPDLIGKLEYLLPPLAFRDFHIAFSRKEKHARTYLNIFNEGLKNLREDGTLTRILHHHGLFPPKSPSGNKVKLTIGTVSNNDMFIMQSLSEAFEKTHPEIELEWRFMDENTLRQRLLSDLAISDGQFDVMTIGGYEAPIWARNGWLLPLTDIPAHYDAGDLIDPVRNALSHENELYALPFYAESSMLYYRRDLIEKLGFSMPAQPTYEEITYFAKALHHPEQGVYGICLRGKPGWGENIALISTMVNSYGGQWFDMNWRPKIDSVEWREAINTYAYLITNFGPPNPTENGYQENLELFRSGRCGIWIDATVAAGSLFDPEKSDVHSQLKFAAAPIGKTLKGASWLWTWALSIPKSSKNQVQALQFITWATSREYIRLVGEEKGWVVAPPGTRKSTYENDHYQQAAPFAQFVYRSIQSADPVDSTLKPKPYSGIQFVGIPEFPAIGRQVGINIAKVVEGRASVEEALRSSQKWVTIQMDRSGYYSAQ